MAGHGAAALGRLVQLMVEVAAPGPGLGSECPVDGPCRAWVHLTVCRKGSRMVLLAWEVPPPRGRCSPWHASCTVMPLACQLNHVALGLKPLACQLRSY